MRKTGQLVTFEGIDGSGKSTQVELLRTWLERKEIKHLILSEPGGTALGESCRDLLKKNIHKDDALSELFLILLSRRHLIEQKILPALKKGWLVICHRFSDSTFAYQGYGRGLDFALIAQMSEILHPLLVPDLTFLLKVESSLMRKTIAKEGQLSLGATCEDNFHDQQDGFFDRIVDGYENLAKENPDRYVKIDGSKKPATVHKQIIKVLEQRIQL